METLVVVAQHRNHYHSRNRAHGPARFGSFGSPPSKDFRGINCRSYQSGAGLLPTPLRSKSCTTPVTKRGFSASNSPRTVSPSVNSRYEEPKNGKKLTRSSAILIPVKMRLDIGSTKEELGSFADEFHFSELWAGPAYSNSPPPSSLPIPKFSLKPKRTVSLELPSSASEIDLDHIAKSAPASPTRELSLSPRDFFDGADSATKTGEHGLSLRGFFDDADSATKTLRRILNLDVTDE